ncbi:MAG: hypothetical protein Q8N99_08355 [Nanoarchaeota archaeon]|nr:hypothetical protein [Nanoarchaeota archaeon]
MGFKINKRKLAISIIIIILWYFFILSVILPDCSLSSFACDCKKGINLIPNCCSCGGDFIFLLREFFFIILPGAFAYIAWSLLEKNKAVKRRKIIEKISKKNKRKVKERRR